MKNLVALTFLLVSIVVNAQIKFNKTDSELELANMRNVFQMADTGYVMVGGSYHDNMINIDVNYYDSLGDFVWNKYYGNPNYETYHGIEGACIKTYSGYILSGSAHYENVVDTDMVYLVKFDESFDTLWTKQLLRDTAWVVARNICNTDDGGYMIVGETVYNDLGEFYHYTYGLMLKVDANGNYEWHKAFGTNEFNDSFWKVTQTHDGGYLVGGATDSWQDGLPYIDKGDWYIVKTDANGNEEWSRRYGNPTLKDGRVTEILRATDTTYYITSGWTYNRNSTGSDLYQESYIVKLDKNFDEVYQLKYDNQEYYKSYIMAAIEAADSNIVLAGVRRDFDSEAMTGYYPRTTIHKMRPDGEIIWQRQYVAEHDTVYGDHKGYSVKQTTDGGYVIGGWVNNDYFSPTQQLWLVKTDSLGCDGTGDFWDCSTGVMVNEFVSNKSFSLYPNPTNNFVIIKNEEFRIMNVDLFDLTGKIVKQFKIHNSELKIQVGDLEKGVYIVRIGKQTKKLIVK